MSQTEGFNEGNPTRRHGLQRHDSVQALLRLAQARLMGRDPEIVFQSEHSDAPDRFAELSNAPIWFAELVARIDMLEVRAADEEDEKGPPQSEPDAPDLFEELVARVDLLEVWQRGGGGAAAAEDEEETDAENPPIVDKSALRSPQLPIVDERAVRSPPISDGSATVTSNTKATWGNEAELDVYILMFLAEYRSRSFLLSVLLFVLQMSMLLLTLVDLLRGPESFNLLKIPINNSGEVIVAQFISLVVLVLLQENTTFVIFAHIVVPPREIKFKDYPSADQHKWMLANVCRLLVHLTSMLTSFIFIVQIDEVIEIFKEFAAVQFVTGLSQLTFICAQFGFFGKTIKQDACYAKAWKHVANEDSVEGLHSLGEAQLAGEKFDKAVDTYEKAKRKAASKDQRRECREKLKKAEREKALDRSKDVGKERLNAGMAFIALGAMITGWAYLVSNQESHKLLASYACQRVDVQLGYDMYDLSNLWSSPFESDLKDRTDTRILMDLKFPSPLYYHYFNGIYTPSWDEIEGDRPVYSETRNVETSGKFSYCEDEKVWVFKIGEFNDRKDRGDCGQWLLRSAPTEEFLLEKVPTDWTVWVGFTRPVSVNLNCMDCSKAATGRSGCNFNGDCNLKGTCTCDKYETHEEKWFGELCQAPPPCKPVDAFVHGQTSEDYHQVAHFMPLNTDSGKRVITYQRPVYWNKRNFSIMAQKFLLYTGRRWYQTDWPLTKLCPDLIRDPNATCQIKQFSIFFENVFHAYWSNTLITSTKYVSEETDSFTPVGLNWFTLEKENSAQGDFGPFGYTFDEGVSTHCFKNDCQTSSGARLCGNNGECENDSRYNLKIRSRCKCKNGSSGYFCQFGANHSYVTNHTSTSDPCNEFFCDYLDEQGLGINCSAQCKRTKDLKECWNTKPDCESDPAVK